MRFLHSRNTAHGHLKPTNLLLDSHWRVRIGDAGRSQFGRDAGTAHFLSPERFEGNEPSAEGDVYSFGSILYEVAVGQPAFSPALREEAVMSQILAQELPPIPARVDRRVAALILGCWSYDCQERPSFDEIFCTLKAMNFRILRGARTEKVVRYVAEIESWEEK
jgi:serine/threonine-protein kinase